MNHIPEFPKIFSYWPPGWTVHRFFQFFTFCFARGLNNLLFCFHRSFWSHLSTGSFLRNSEDTWFRTRHFRFWALTFPGIRFRGSFAWFPFRYSVSSGILSFPCRTFPEFPRKLRFGSHCWLHFRPRFSLVGISKDLPISYPVSSEASVPVSFGIISTDFLRNFRNANYLLPDSHTDHMKRSIKSSCFSPRVSFPKGTSWSVAIPPWIRFNASEKALRGVLPFPVWAAAFPVFSYEPDWILFASYSTCVEGSGSFSKFRTAWSEDHWSTKRYWFTPIYFSTSMIITWHYWLSLSKILLRAVVLECCVSVFQDKSWLILPKISTIFGVSIQITPQAVLIFFYFAYAKGPIPLTVVLIFSNRSCQ